MLKLLPLLALIFAAPVVFAATPTPVPSGWQAKVTRDLPLLGHRNWILIVDSAYPMQSSTAVETVETNANQLDVVRYVLAAVESSIHVRPDVFMDAELPFVSEDDAPGVDAYKAQIGKLLEAVPVGSVPHEKMISDIDDAGKLVHILVLKTKLAIPYTSVFIRLNCKYWSDDAEERMRTRMANAAPAPQ
jgi:hypothetical protein